MASSPLSLAALVALPLSALTSPALATEADSGGGNTIIGGGNGGNNVIGGRPWRPDPDRRPGGRPGR